MIAHRLYKILVLGFILLVAPALYSTAGLLPTIIITVSLIGGFIIWIKFSLPYPTEPRKLIPVYSLMVLSLWVHIWEEYQFDFGSRIGNMTGSGWTDSQFLVTFGFIFPFLWILAIFGLVNKHPLAYYIASFVAFGMFLGEPTHVLVFPNVEGGPYHYFPGMWTALLPMIFGIWTIFLMIQDSRNATKKY